MKKQGLRQWIRDNRHEIDECINRVEGERKRNDEERRLWVLNDEGLYNWARRERVNV